MGRSRRILVTGLSCGLLAAVASLAMAVLVMVACHALGLPQSDDGWLIPLMERVGSARPGREALVVAAFLFGALVFSPVAEEILFRKFIQDWLKSRMRLPAALGVTASLFAAVHLSPHGFLPLVAVSLAFSLARARAGLEASILAHSLYNMASLAMALLANPALENFP